MSKKKKILIIGLPLFAKRLADEMMKYDKENSYKSLNTYYNLWDKIKAPFVLYFSDVLYSINGTLDQSKLISLAFWLKKRVVMHWVGSDVTTAIKQYKSGDFNKIYFNKSEHLTVAPWLSEELKEIGLNASVMSISAYQKDFRLKSFPERFTVLSYIPENRANFYGKEQILKLANELPEVKFIVVGSLKETELPANIDLKGWVNNINEVIESSVVVIRYMKHDGLSQLVLESLALGRYVLYSRDQKGAIYVKNYNELYDQLLILKSAFDSGKLSHNIEGANQIRKNYNKELIFSGLKRFLEK